MDIWRLGVCSLPARMDTDLLFPDLARSLLVDTVGEVRYNHGSCLVAG